MKASCFLVRKTYSEEFRRDAVELPGDRGAHGPKIVGDLGVTDVMLSVWIMGHPQMDAQGLIASTTTINPYGK